jgi:hypothetical protein
MLTYEIIHDALQFHAAVEIRMSQHFSADRIHAHALLVNGYLFVRGSMWITPRAKHFWNFSAGWGDGLLITFSGRMRYDAVAAQTDVASSTDVGRKGAHR